MTVSTPTTAYFASYLDLAWQTNPDTGLRAWVEAFQQALDNWQESECQRLLQEIKRAPFTAEIEQVVRYAEGRLAEQQGNFQQATRYYGESLALAHAAGYPLREAAVRVELGRLCSNLGQHTEAVDHLQAALAIYESTEGDAETIAGVLNQLGVTFTHLGRWQEARACFDRGLSLVQTPAGRAALLTNLGSWHQERGEVDSAVERYSAALQIYQETNALDEQTLLLNNLGLATLAGNQFESAQEHLTAALTTLQTRQDWPGTIRTLGNLALVAYTIGDFEAALGYYTEAIESARSLGDEQAIATFLNLRGILLIDLDEWEAAVPDLEQSLELARQAQDRPAEVVALNNLGTGYRHLEEYEKALAHFQSALSLAEALGHVGRQAEICGNLGHLYSNLEDTEQASHYYQRSVALAEQVGDSATACNSLLDLGMMALQRNDPNQLEELGQRAQAWGEQAGQPDLLTRVKWLAGDLAMLRGDVEGIFAAYGEAAVVAAQAGDELLEATLERIEIHLTGLNRQEIAAVCQQLQHVWAGASLLSSNSTLSAWFVRCSER